VIAPLLAQPLEAEVGRQHQRWSHRTVGGVTVNAGTHGAGGRSRTDRLGDTHAVSPVGRRAVSSSASMRADSFRKASCPYGERNTRRVAGPARPSTKATMSASGTRRSP